MSKELEALERLKTAPSFMGGTAEYQFCTKSETLLMQDYETVKQALHRLESIDNANPSEALKCLEKVYSRLPQWDLSRNVDQCNIIKQALLKAQEQEKILSIIKGKNVDLGMVDFFNNVEDYNEWLTLQPNESRKPLSEYEFELIKQ